MKRVTNFFALSERCSRSSITCAVLGSHRRLCRLRSGGELEAALARYRRYLILERGIRNASASRYIELMRPFLQTKVLPDGLALALRSLTAADVISFVVTNCPRLSPGTAGLTVSALLSLLGFLYVDGASSRSLRSAVPTVPCRQLTGLPKGLAPDHIPPLLPSSDTTT